MEKKQKNNWHTKTKSPAAQPSKWSAPSRRKRHGHLSLPPRVRSIFVLVASAHDVLTVGKAHALGLPSAHFQHLLVDVADHRPGVPGRAFLTLLPVARVLLGDVLPRRRAPGPPPLLGADVFQETEGDVA